ncbi:MAG: diguanylate cyclase [Lachnospiraceae bacterium]|nr:diguanylate cyclase [Lachnospiraceae bacterium]
MKNDSKKVVMCVDDSISNLKYIEHILKNRFQLILKMSGEEAIEELSHLRKKPDLILLDVIMPGIDGFETYRRIKQQKENEKIPVVFLTGDTNVETEESGMELGADDFIVKPIDPITLQYRLTRILEYDAMRKTLTERLVEKEKESEKLMIQLITTIANTIDSRTGFTRYYSMRVSQYAEEIARRLGLSLDECKKARYMGLIHGIGMISVPTNIYSKMGKLSDEEFDEVKKHTLIGSQMLSNIPSLDGAADVALYHHERYDGKGYPYGLKGEEIPLMARIISAASALVAMNSDRPYREKMSFEEIRKIFAAESAKQFDPQVVSVVLKILEDGINFDEDTFRRMFRNTYKADEERLVSDFLFQYTKDIELSTKTDALTGLWDRSFLEERVGNYLANNHSGVLIMLDMDNFKYVNDTFGHITGDSMLIRFSTALRSMIRNEDIVSRVGGDEFCIFMTGNISRLECEKKATRILEHLETVFRDISQINQCVTVSMGIAIAPDDGEDFITLYKKADAALYHVKKNGKNGFYFYGEDVVEDRPKSFEQQSRASIEEIERIINVSDERGGAFEVEYNAFQDIYQFVKRSQERDEKTVQLLLFTVAFKEEVPPEAANECMEALRDAIRVSLRRGDVTNHFSGSQYVVLLMGASTENASVIAERISRSFVKNTQDRFKVGLSYDISEVKTD